MGREVPEEIQDDISGLKTGDLLLGIREYTKENLTSGY
jgi:hypothetical protein